MFHGPLGGFTRFTVGSTSLRFENARCPVHRLASRIRACRQLHVRERFDALSPESPR